ncbi:hypothetical protein C8R46DRAFT_1062755 [Mycena filopes]|nr:hypothetical protein C8R46DRAFT_1149507 [Mycena filopes]KAJ7186199.1 hypothetical protein C8R46DRAFT_1062755 [Mycena filopes]
MVAATRCVVYLLVSDLIDAKTCASPLVVHYVRAVEAAILDAPLPLLSYQDSLLRLFAGRNSLAGGFGCSRWT